MSLRSLKTSFDKKFNPKVLRNILTKEKDPSKIKQKYFDFYKEKGLDTSKSLMELFKDMRTTKQTKERLAILDKFVRKDKTPPDYIETINEMKNFIGGSNPMELEEELGYLTEGTDWVVKLDNIKPPTQVEVEEEKEDKKMPTIEEEKMGMVKEEIATLEAEAAAKQSKPAGKPKEPKDTYPKKEKKKPKVEASKPKPPTVDTTPEKEMTDIEKSKVKVAKAEQKLKETIESIPEPEPQAPSMSEPVPEPIKLKTLKKERLPSESQINEPKVVETEVKTGLEDIPSKIDLIPPERLSSEFKSAKELESDIQYFFKTFPKPLEKIKKTYSKAKKTPQYLKRTHKRIVAILRAGAKETKEKVGVIVEGSEFIKDKLREIYLEEINKGLTAEDLIMNVQKEDKSSKEDIGFYEIKKGPSGKEHSQREPIYAAVPEGEEFDAKKEIKKEPARLKTLPTEYRSRFTYEDAINKNNPFVRPQSKIQLRKLY